MVVFNSYVSLPEGKVHHKVHKVQKKSIKSPFFSTWRGRNVEMFIHVMDIFEPPGTCEARQALGEEAGLNQYSYS